MIRFRSACTAMIAIILINSALAGTLLAAEPTSRPAMEIPDDFPRFRVPGCEKQMTTIRELFYHHFKPAGPLCTLWDEWMTGPTLWPAVAAHEQMRERWVKALAGRTIDAEGYVATHQHASIAHQLGWPFPFWALGGGDGWGWHFSLNVAPNWHGTGVKTQEGWKLGGAADKGISDGAWNIELTSPMASAQPPDVKIGVLQSPFIQFRWRAKGLGLAQPYIEWTTKEAPEFSPQRRMYFAPVESNDFVYTMVPVYRHPEWQGRITGLRVAFGNPHAGATVSIQALFTQYDTRHNINNSCFVKGCINDFLWTHDVNLLRDQIGRMRLALRYMMSEFKTQEEKVVVTLWVGHDGRPGLNREKPGPAVLRHGHGVGHDYWDILPIGYKDGYATLLYYDAVRAMAAMEAEIVRHPEWNIPGGALAMDPAALEKHAAEVRAKASEVFWNPQTRRFVTGIDQDGKIYDYGYTFMNLEAIYYGVASPEQAADIMSWINGQRIVEGDTSQGADIYHWRFAPRASTKRNLEWYGWFWSSPESIPFGDQVQDGGAVLGFSYHDLMSRVSVLGPENAWARLKEIATWFDEVQVAGGYRKYYAVPGRGSMQGGGQAGGLGLDMEFFESILVPQVMLRGFLGFEPMADGFRINPRLPGAWPELTIDRIALHELVLSVRVTPNVIEVRKQGTPTHPYRAALPAGKWTVSYLDLDGKVIRREATVSDGGVDLGWADAAGVRFEKAP